MASVTNLRYGSSGEDVKQMQQALINAGYDVGSTGADGVFGKNTEAAVRQYQTANGLTVDGIAGKNTLGMLYGSNNTQTVNANARSAGNASNTAAGTNTGTGNQITTATGYTYGAFTDPENVTSMNTAIGEHDATKPGDWVNTDNEHYNTAMGYKDQYDNRDPFSYDFNKDALYNLYKDSYIQQGQMAMMDAMGQAAAMTGGYGNSWAQSVGQQTYNQYLTQLNNMIPELYQIARDQYNQEGQDLLKMYDMSMGLYTQEYGEYQDTVNEWWKEHNDLVDQRDTARQNAWDEWVANNDIQHEDYNTKQEWDREDDRNAKLDQQTAYNNLWDKITTYGYNPTDAELEAAGMTREEANALLNVYNEAKTQKDNANKLTDANNKLQYRSNLESMIALGYTPDEDELAMAGMTWEDVERIKRSVDPTAGYTVSASGWVTSPYGRKIGYDRATVMKVQQYLGLEPTGVWNRECEDAANAAGFKHGLDDAFTAMKAGDVAAVSESRAAGNDRINKANGTNYAPTAVNVKDVTDWESLDDQATYLRETGRNTEHSTAGYKSDEVDKSKGWIATNYYAGYLPNDTSSDISKYGAFDNGYQPKGISGHGKLTKTGTTFPNQTFDRDGNKKTVTQNIFVAEDGTYWYWEGRAMRYYPATTE